MSKSSPQSSISKIYARAISAMLGAIIFLAPSFAQAVNYRGAVLLRGDENVTVEGINSLAPQHQAFWHWQGDTLFAGATDPRTGNQVELLAEFFWFETSLDRNSDFYSVVLKVKSSPAADGAWELEVDPGEHWYNPNRAFKPCQEVVVNMDPSGAAGGIRWDWAVPFTDYKWDPMRTIEVEQGYSLGVDTEGTVMSEIKRNGTKAKVQGKGTFDWSRKVSTNYTITLYAWQMMVAGGAERQAWQLALNDDERSKQSAYHEYILIVQSDKGQDANLESIEFVGHFKEDRWLASDQHQVIAAMLNNIRIAAPSADDVANGDRRAEDVTGGADDGGTNRGAENNNPSTGGNNGGGTFISGSSTNAVMMSEIFYDSPGRDAGTFVELMGPPGQELDGLALVAVGGRDGEPYATIDLAGYRIADNGLFVIAQDDSVANADMIDSKVNLKNGPDNLLLVQDRDVIDALGYGEFERGHFFAGESAPALTESGKSIGRISLTDTNDNAFDYVILDAPSPGEFNAPGMAAGPGNENGVIGVSCSLNSDCPGSQLCSPTGACIDECRADKDCAGEGVCSRGSCTMPAGEVGGAECLRHSDCPEGRICSAVGTCINECVTDRDCSGGRCMAGSCDGGKSGVGVNYECELNSDCDGGEVCNPAGQCIAECRADRDCPGDMTCQASQCVPGFNEFLNNAGASQPSGCSTSGDFQGVSLATMLLALGLIPVLRRRREA